MCSPHSGWNGPPGTGASSNYSTPEQGSLSLQTLWVMRNKILFIVLIKILFKLIIKPHIFYRTRTGISNLINICTFRRRGEKRPFGPPAKVIEKLHAAVGVIPGL